MNRNILALDFGSEKITAVLAATDEETGTLRLRRAFSQPCPAVNACFVRDLAGAADALSKLFADISEYVSFNPTVVVGLRGNFLSFKRASGFKNTEGRNRIVSAKDIQDAIDNSIPSNLNETLEVVDILPQSYTIDGNVGIKNPKGMAGFCLEVETFISCAMVTHLNNLNKILADCECNDYQVIPSSVALGETLLRPEEKQGGTMLLDIGGAHSSAIMYHKGTIVDAWELSCGTEHMAQEVADLLQNDLPSARQVLKEYRPGDDDIMDDVLEDASKNMLKQIKKELLQSLLYVKYPSANVVICGGGANKTLLKAAKNVFSARKIRLAGHEDLIADFEDAEKPSYTTGISLILHALVLESRLASPVPKKKEEGFLGGILSKLGLNELI